MSIKANIIVDQGSTYYTNIDVQTEDGQAVDLTGYSGRAQIRKHYTSTTATNFDIDIDNGDGTISLALSANATASLVAGRYVYDVELTSSDGIVERVLEGIVTVTPNVTR
jgi:hypothetical protein